MFLCGGTVTFGFERVILRYIEGLAARNSPIYCTASGWTDGVFASELRRIGVAHELIKLGWIYISQWRWTLDSLRHLPQARAQFVQVNKKFAPDLVIHSGYRSIAMSAGIFGSKHIVAVQDYWTSKWETALIRRLDRNILAYLACSEDIRNHLISIGLPPEKIYRIYNPMTFPDQPPPRAAVVRPFTFGITGQVIERKGHHIIFQAIAEIHKKHPALALQLKIFGQGNDAYVAKLHELAKQLNIDSDVQWCGYRDHLDKFYPEFDCALVPTITPDPCPLAAIEPGAYALPAITSMAGGLAELVIDGQTGFLVPTGDAHALAARMVELVQNPELAKTLGNQAFTANRQRFAEPVVIDQLDEVFQILTATRLNFHAT